MCVKTLSRMGVFFLSLWVVGIAQAQYLSHNRPSPLMDYVPQEIGMYDTVYEELTETDCRGCHGNSLANRHHATERVVRYGLCTYCHDSSAGSTGVIRDCTTTGCHSPDDLTGNGWHHNTDEAVSGNCVVCHDPNLVSRISPVRDLNRYPPSIITPTPFSCENCHWPQALSVTGNPHAPGHPSTYDHTSPGGVSGEFYEYGKPIYGTSDTHHMGFRGGMVRSCYGCHSIDSSRTSWSPDDPELIRYCEKCHDVSSLHRIAPHVEGTPGWVATGFHISGDSPVEENPVVYRTSGRLAIYAPQAEPKLSASEMCVGCHGDAFIGTTPSPEEVPVIDSMGPTHGVCGAIVVLHGANFSEEQTESDHVQLEIRSDQWVELPAVSWTSTQIEFQLPCWEFDAGNYKVRVATSHGESNQVNFTVENVSVTSLSPETGRCDTAVELAGIGFGKRRTEMLDDYYGVHHVVEFVSTQGVFTALDYGEWSDTRIRVKITEFFEDQVNSNMQVRNFLRDTDEPMILACDDFEHRFWSVYLLTAYFADDDGNGQFSGGDTVLQVVPSHPYYFSFIKEASATGNWSNDFYFRADGSSMGQLVDIDGNGDGREDCRQENVISLLTPGGEDYVTIESPPGTTLADAEVNEEIPGAATLPPEGDYPYGFMTFAVEDVELGGEAVVKIYLPEDAAPSTYFKYGPESGNETPHWYEFMYDETTGTGAVIDGNVITLYFVDGARGDDDLEVNGRIVDDGGPGSESDETSGGCFIGTLS